MSTDTIAVIDAADIASATIHELPGWGKRSQMYYELEIDLGGNSREELREVLKHGDRRVAALLDGDVVAFEHTNRTWLNSPRFAFSTLDSAQEVASKLGLEPSMIHATDELIESEKERFEEYVSKLFWSSKCDPASSEARELQDQWQKLQVAYPEVLSRIDCEASPSR